MTSSDKAVRKKTRVGAGFFVIGAKREEIVRAAYEGTQAGDYRAATKPSAKKTSMVGVVKWLRPRVVAPVYVGSNPTIHPIN